MKNGVPFDVAFQADAVFRNAAGIVFSEFGGRKFNFQAMDFEPEEG